MRDDRVCLRPMKIAKQASKHQSTAHQQALKQALLAVGITFVWMILEAAVSLLLGAAARSLLLEGFGLDSLIELLSAGVLLWRLDAEYRRGLSAESLEAVEGLASRIAGILLAGLALLLTVLAMGRLLGHTLPTDTERSVWGVLVGLAAKVVMPLLAAWKFRLAEKLQSRALRADAMESAACGYLSLVLVVGLLAERLLGWRWIDGAATLLLVPFLLREARAAFFGLPCCGHCAVEEQKDEPLS
jgi:Co/Zn/Cd efflux system component